MNLSDLLNQNDMGAARINGVIIGIVTDNLDPKQLGRVRVKFPTLHNSAASCWARMVSLMAGKDRGTFFLPEVNDEVLVAFENGDPALPYVLGALWNGVDVPPETNKNGRNTVRVIKSRSGHIIRFIDENGEEKIEIVDKSEKNKIVISTKDNTVTVMSDGDIVLSALQGTIKLEAKQIEMKSSAQSKIDADSGMEITSQGTMTIRGTTVNIN